MQTQNTFAQGQHQKSRRTLLSLCQPATSTKFSGAVILSLEGLRPTQVNSRLSGTVYCEMENPNGTGSQRVELADSISLFADERTGAVYSYFKVGNLPAASRIVVELWSHVTQRSQGQLISTRVHMGTAYVSSRSSDNDTLTLKADFLGTTPPCAPVRLAKSAQVLEHPKMKFAFLAGLRMAERPMLKCA